MSPALWPGARAIFPYLDRASHVPGRLYVDIGTAELPGAVSDARRLQSVLERKGYGSAELLYVEEEGAGHQESAWARRFPGMIRFLLGATM
jgi:predicted alpha/beta superfamily hydrolase